MERKEPQPGQVSSLWEKASQFPGEPGVYKFQDQEGRILYVGKAVNLRNRITSYFQPQESPRLQALMSRAVDVDYMVTDTEVEALVLEGQLIKEYQPRYNVNLKDDKDYPYLKLTGETYPRLELVRLPEKRHPREEFQGKEPLYFGPYTQVRPLRKTLRFLKRVFPLRSCRQPLDGSPRGRPCLNFQMGRCLGPCRGKDKVSPEEYLSLVEQVSLFLQGQQENLVGELKRKMEEAAQNLDFEKAAVYRDRLQNLQSLQENQKLHPPSMEDVDVLALVEEGGECAVHLFRIREGRLRGQEHFALTVGAPTCKEEMMSGFLKNYYSRGVIPPGRLLLNVSPSEISLLGDWLSRLRGQKVEILLPQRGEKKELVILCQRNGLFQLREKNHQRLKETSSPGLVQLEKLLEQETIDRIEGYDISHLGGGETVGSMVVFQQGFPFKEGYRRFRIRGNSGGDDLAALQEVVGRRLENSEMPLPHLMLVDGGRTQLEAVAEILNQKGVEVPLISLAKKQEGIFFQGQDAPLLLPGNHPALRLLQRIRDEAHRFAIDYHRNLRERSTSSSVLEKVPGVGKQRRIRLLQHFGSLEALMGAAPEELERVPGVSRQLAQRLYQYLHQQ